jgi:tRNA nucleotidyltransferase (CCA-adding enzyme)
VSHPASLEIPAAVLEIVAALEAAGYETWCVGGAIRDGLLGDTMVDVDLATAASPGAVQRIFRRTVPVGIEHGTIGVVGADSLLHEVTTFRRDVRTDGRHAEVDFGVSLDDDLARRDFTINAIAWHPLRREWRDPFHGRDDLDGRLVRAVGDPAQRFREDRLRILRALRFAARFDFTIEDLTWRAACDQAHDTGHLSAERVREEWWKGVSTARDSRHLLRLWQEVGVADVWLADGDVRWSALPDLPPAITRDPVLLLAAWRTPVAPILRRLKASGAEIGRGRAIDRGPAAPASADPAAVRRWMASVGGAATDLVLLARVGAETTPAWIGTWDAVVARGDATTRAGLAVSGDDLAAAGIAEPGPAMGAILDRLLAAVVDDPALNQRETLLDLARGGSP